jgi:hypothetical protein
VGQRLGTALRHLLHRHRAERQLVIEAHRAESRETHPTEIPNRDTYPTEREGKAGRRGDTHSIEPGQDKGHDIRIARREKGPSTYT